MNRTSLVAAHLWLPRRDRLLVAVRGAGSSVPAVLCRPDESAERSLGEHLSRLVGPLKFSLRLAQVVEIPRERRDVTPHEIHMLYTARLERDPPGHPPYGHQWLPMEKAGMIDGIRGLRWEEFMRTAGETRTVGWCTVQTVPAPPAKA